jgi:ATP-dependent Clp protease ATP-binding subunit ClpB
VFQRALHRLLVRVPAQDPPPDEVEMSTAASKILRAAQKIQKDKVKKRFPVLVLSQL